jgi:excisionase family DNA binding protein
MPPTLLTPRELGERLNVSYESILTWARREEIPSIKDSRNRRLFNLDAVLQALRSRAAIEPQRAMDRHAVILMGTPRSDSGRSSSD